jgi:hypothetical protein
MAGSVNQNSRFDLGVRKVFFIPAPKIVLQQYRPIADSCTAAKRHNFGASLSCGRLALHSTIWVRSRVNDLDDRAGLYRGI